MLHDREYGWPSGDAPGAISFQHDVSTSLVETIWHALAAVFSPVVDASNFRLSALHDSATPAGSYLLNTSKGSWFLRISTRIGDWQFEQAIMQYLHESEVAVNPIVASAEFEWEGHRFRTDIRPLINGRHFQGDPADLSALAHTLGRCHRALKGAPTGQKVRQNQSVLAGEHANAHALLSDALTRGDFAVFHEREAWAIENCEWLAEMNVQYNPNFHEYPKAQSIHGEIHPGNVIFDQRTGAATLVDFETSVHAYAPPAWDLAYFALRFLNKKELSVTAVRKQMLLIEEAYGETLPPLFMMMRQTCWYCIMCSVSNRLLKGMIAPLSEFDKFVKLERLAADMQGVL